MISEETTRQFRSLGVPILPLADTVRLSSTGQFKAVADFLRLFDSIGKRTSIETSATIYAEVFTSSGRRDLTQSEYERLMADAQSYAIFADERTRTAIKIEGRRQKRTEKILPSYFRMLRIAMSKRGRFDPVTDRLTENQVSAKQVFQHARKVIDLKRNGRWTLFKSEKVGNDTAYLFQPDPNIEFALIFLPHSLPSH